MGDSHRNLDVVVKEAKGTLDRVVRSVVTRDSKLSLVFDFFFIHRNFRTDSEGFYSLDVPTYFGAKNGLYRQDLSTDEPRQIQVIQVQVLPT